MNALDFIDLNDKELQKNYVFVGNNYLSKKMAKRVLGANYKILNKLPSTTLLSSPILIKDNKKFQDIKFNNLKRKYKYVIIFNKADKRKRLFKSIPDENIVYFNETSGNFITNQIKNKLGVNHSKANKLYKYCNEDLSLVFTELQKLKWLSKEKVDKYISNLVVNEDKDIFKFLNKLFKGDNYVDIYEKLPDNELKILFMVQKQLKGMIICKDLKHSNNSHISNNYNLHPYQVKIYKQLSMNINLETLKSLFLEACEIERKIKTGKVDSKVGVDNLILKIYSA